MIPPQLTRSQRVIRDMLDYRQEHLLDRRDIGPELVRDLVDWGLGERAPARLDS